MAHEARHVFSPKALADHIPSIVSASRSCAGPLHINKGIRKFGEMLVSTLEEEQQSRNPVSAFMTLQNTSIVTAMAVTEDPLRLFVGQEDNVIKVWDLEEFKCIHEIHGHGRSITALLVLDGKLFSVAADKTCRVWDIHNGFACLSVTTVTRAIILALAGSGSTLIFGLQDTSVRTAQYLSPGDSEEAHGNGSGQDAKIVDMDSSFNPLRHWRHLKGHFGFVYCTAVERKADATKSQHQPLDSSIGSSSGERLFTGGGDGQIIVWSLPNLERVTTLVGHSGSVFALDISDSMVFSGSQDKTIRCWDTDSLKCKTVLQGHEAEVLCLCTALNGRRLCSGSADNTVCIWDTNTLTKITTLHGHESVVHSLVCADVFVVSASADGAVKVWDVNFMEPSNANPEWLLNRSLPYIGNDKGRKSEGSMIYLLRQFVGIRTVSGDPTSHEECWRGAKMLQSLLYHLGAETRLAHSSPSQNPVVLGKLVRDPSLKTILVYGHYDVVPANERDGWHSPPFSLTGRDGYLYGRGVSDDKGPIIALFYAIQEAVNLERENVENGKVPNFIFVFEGEGENGSGGFKEAILENSDWFEAVSLVFISNNYWLGEDTPCLTYGLRGQILCSLEVSGAKRDLHTGVDGGSIREPLVDLIALLSSVIDSKTGLCTAPGFYDNVRPVGPAEEALYDAIDWDFEGYKAVNGIPKLRWEDPLPSGASTPGGFRMGSFLGSSSSSSSVVNAVSEPTARRPSLSAKADSSASSRADSRRNKAKKQVLMSRWRSPSVSVTCFKSSLDDHSVIPRGAMAMVTIRTVPDQESEKVAERFIAHCQEQFQALDTWNHLSISVKRSIGWWLADTNNMYYRAAERAIHKHWGVKPNYVREGGTIQATSFLADHFKAPALHFPMGQSTDSAHLQNERMRLKNLFLGKVVMRDFFLEVGKQSADGG